MVPKQVTVIRSSLSNELITISKKILQCIRIVANINISQHARARQGNNVLALVQGTEVRISSNIWRSRTIPSKYRQLLPGYFKIELKLQAIRHSATRPKITAPVSNHDNSSKLKELPWSSSYKERSKFPEGLKATEASTPLFCRDRHRVVAAMKSGLALEGKHGGGVEGENSWFAEGTNGNKGFKGMVVVDMVSSNS